MQYILLFPPKQIIRWYIDEFGFLQLELVEMSQD
jgi:hypothetical protein